MARAMTCHHAAMNVKVSAHVYAPLQARVQCIRNFGIRVKEKFREETG